MKGADKYAQVFDTQQIERLYLVSSNHARGLTFRIFVLPKGEEVIPNGNGNAPLNKDAVEVYGVVSGQPGWTEEYGWLYEGPWQQDFFDLFDLEILRIENDIVAKGEEEAYQANEEESRKINLLSGYKD